MSHIPSYLVDNKLHYVMLLELLRRGSADLLWAGEEGILLYDHCSGAHIVSARTEGAFRTIDALVPDGCDTLVGHELWYLEREQDRLGLETIQICHSAAYLDEAPPAPPDFGGELRLLGPEWAQGVYESYEHAFGGVAYIQGAIGRGMLGAFLDGTLAGFVGFHEEGSIGMLEVLPGFRRRGVGEALERAAVRLALERGQYAFGQVIQGNEASLSLQRKVGMEISGERLFWLF